MQADFTKQITYINSILGEKNKSLGKSFRINFEDNIEEFLSSLSESDLKRLNRMLGFFKIHMEPIWFLTNIEDKKTTADLFSEHVWAKFAISIMISILDFLTYSKKDGSLSDFLKRNFNSIKSPTDIDIFMSQYESGMKKRLFEFYTNYLTDEEKKDLINSYAAIRRYENKLKINSLKNVIDDIYIKVRSDFLHKAGLETMDNESTIFTLKDPKKPLFLVHRNFSACEFVVLTWEGIFRYFGYAGKMNSKFSKEEMKQRMSFQGIKIGF